MFKIEVNVFLIQNKYFSAFHSYEEKKIYPNTGIIFSYLSQSPNRKPSIAQP